MKTRYRTLTPAALSFCTLSLLGFYALPLRAADLPDGPGKVLIERECGSCHDTAHVEGKRTKDEWIDTVSKMMDRGATLNSMEFDTVIDYLVRNFGKEEKDDKKIGIAVPAKK